MKRTSAEEIRQLASDRIESNAIKFGESNFICLLEHEGRWIVNDKVSLTDEEYFSMTDGDYLDFYKIVRSNGRAEVHYEELVGPDGKPRKETRIFTLDRDVANILSDVEVARLCFKDFVSRSNLMNFLKEEYSKEQRTSWPLQELTEQFGKGAVRHWQEAGYIAYSLEGVVSLSHTVPGTLAHALMQLGNPAELLSGTQQYFSDFKEVPCGTRYFMPPRSADFVASTSPQ